MENQNSYIFSFSKFLIQLIIATAITGFIFSYIFEKQIILKSEISGAAKVNRIINFTNPNEIPIFGSSRAEGSFVPSIITDKDSFNYGMVGTQANIWLFFLEEELKKDKKTDIIINIDLWGMVYSDGSIANYLPNYDKVNHILNEQGKVYYQIPFLKYIGQYEHYFKSYLNQKLNLTKITDNGGRFEKNKLTFKKFNELVEKRLATNTIFSEDQKLTQKLDKLIKSTKRRIIFVVAPCHSSVFESFDNIEDSNTFLYKLNQKENTTVLDLRNYIDSDSLFINTLHVNYDGAVVFSKQLRQLLKNEHIKKSGYGPYLSKNHKSSHTAN